MLLAMFGNYVLAGLKFLGSLPVASISDPANPGSSFAIYPGVGLARVNGRFVGLPYSSKTAREPPTNIIEIATPSHKAFPTPISTATFDPRSISSQISTGALVALNLLVILWSFSLLTLSLTRKSGLSAIHIWFATLYFWVVQTICIISQSIVCIVLSVTFDLKRIYHEALDSLAGIAAGPSCRIQGVLNITQTLVYSRFKWTIAFVLANLRVLLFFCSVAAFTNIVQQITLFCDIDIPYIDLLLVIAASPAIAASGILFAVLLGVIKPNCPNPRFITVVHAADMVAGMRVKRSKRFLADLAPQDHTGGTLLDIREAYHQILRTRRQALAAKSLVERLKKITVLWIAISVFGFGINYISCSPPRMHFYVSSRAENSFEPKTFHSTATAVTATSSPLTLIWTPGVCAPSANNSVSRLQSIKIPDIVQINSQFTPFPRLGSLVEHSNGNDTV